MAEAITDEVEEKAEDAKDEVEEAAGRDSDGLGKRLLVPAAAGAATLAATYAARKAPQVYRERVKPTLEQTSGKEGAMAGVAGKALETLAGGGQKKTRRLPIQRWTDVAVPVETAFRAWTQFEDFPKFMHRVLSVEQKDDNHVSWQEKIWFSTRQWEAEITDRRENERIAWKTVTGTSHLGVVTFHQLDDRLTRVMVTVEFHPNGTLEKLASALRFAKRAVEADLARFKAYVEFEEAKGLEYGHAVADQSNQRSEEDESSSGAQGNGQRDSAGARDRLGSEMDAARQERAERREQRRASQS